MNRPIDKPYFEAALAGEFRLQKCSACSTWRFPPSTICPKCLSGEYTWELASGRGTIWSFLVMHQLYFPEYRDRLPYNVVFVELEEGPFMISNVVDAENSDLSTGAPVEVFIDRVNDELALPRFRLA